MRKLLPFICVLLLLLGGFALTSYRSAPTPHSPSKPKAFQVVETTIADVHQAFKQGDCNCEQLVTAYLQRIEAYDQPTKLNAIVLTNPQALEIARQLDAEYRSTKKLRPLHCIPLIVKDNYNTAGLQTTAGSLALKGFVPLEDATTVKALKAAGAIVLAKSNMAEWAFSPMVSISSLAGETLNPYNLLHVPAGSSGGTAAAVAANLGTAGLGTDTGNSIRGPSSHTALVGFRPTLGLVSRAGIAPLYLRNDTGGPMTRTVADATRLLEVMAGYDPADPLTKYSEGKIPKNYQQFLDKNGLKGARIGVLRTLSERKPDPQVKALFERAIADLQKAGAIIVDPVEVPNFASVSKDQWCSVFQHDINDYLAALGPQAPVKSLNDIVASGKFAPYIAENLTYHQQHTEGAQGTTCTDAYTDTKRIAFRKAITDVMDRYQVSALIYPTWNNPPAKVGDFKGYKGDNSQLIAPHTGQPAFTVPMGFTYDNLPAGLQLLGRPFDEPTLIKYTYAYEQATKHRKAPALFPALPASK
ncbi:amidase family protein [Hymenobacter mucosus]|uniref:Asp-tRNAAsn/Glu-tRNAGln amidotransferase A subunit n=1 Tax=Hymenobacter mucosus TaxID=1411120 RepID=A0A238W809_9BACT|nr:amidase family protein [Hymenobacter mucosus]SNR42690.1 Asp-tRNAAsn/Glu-tRNAGln amidotransferase A subunit [Hymenobacter mucosus]